MQKITSLYEIREQWKEVVFGLRTAELALRKLKCDHQANCIADIMDAAMEAQDAVEKQLSDLSLVEYFLSQMNPMIHGEVAQ